MPKPYPADRFATLNLASVTRSTGERRFFRLLTVVRAGVFSGTKGCMAHCIEESYALVHAIDGDGYGYGGRTRNARWAEANPG